MREMYIDELYEEEKISSCMGVSDFSLAEMPHSPARLGCRDSPVS